MRFSQRGSRDNRIKLVWSKYFNYKLEGKNYYLKQKAYMAHHDGWTEHEIITGQTYKNAIKRGSECIEVIVEKDIMSASLNALGLIFSKQYEVSEEDARGAILKSKAAIKKIREDSKTSAAVEYKIFKRVLDCHINLSKEDPEDIAI